MSIQEVNKLFGLLNKAGMTAEEHFLCCNNCGHAAMRGDEKVREYAFYHGQDLDSFEEDGVMHIRYGIGPAHDEFEEEGEDQATLEVAKKIVTTCNLAGFETEWDGRVEHTITIR